MVIEKVKELDLLISENENVMVVGHLNPDGDCIGSIIGFFTYLLSKGKNIMLVVPNKYPDFLKFLDLDNNIVVFEDNEKSVEKFLKRKPITICLDFNSLKRIVNLGELIDKADVKKVLIDHHPNPEQIFELSISYPQLSSTCELVYHILRNLNGNSDIPIQGAKALYTGMMTDTNNFSNSVLPSTFKMAGELLEMGVNKEMIQNIVLGNFSQNRMRLMGYMLNENMKIFGSLNASIMILTNDIMERYKFENGDSESFVNLALNIKGVGVSALFTQENDYLKVSLRSKNDFSVNRFAREYFNGGGHERAAGGRVFIPINEIENYFVNSFKEFVIKEGY